MSQRQSHSSPSASFPLLLGSGGQTRGPPNARGVTWMVISRQIPAPISEGSPYIPVITYTMDWPMVMIMPNTRKQKAMFSRWGKPHCQKKRSWHTHRARREAKGEGSATSNGCGWGHSSTYDKCFPPKHSWS